MKKVVMLLLAVVMCFLLTACNLFNDSEDLDKEVSNQEDTSDVTNESFDNGIAYTFGEDVIEINYSGLYTVMYYFENDMVTYSDLIYTFETEEAAIEYEENGSFGEATTVIRDGEAVIIRNDYSEQKLTRTVIEEMVKSLKDK